VNLAVEAYTLQLQRWPKSGQHILAQFDADTIVVYQAYSPEIGNPAAQKGRFGEGFSLDRMSWIKPNFLWMMYRSGWATKAGQQVTLAIRLRRAGFDQILSEAVHSSYIPGVHASKEQWKSELPTSPVRLQWDPDHDPSGAKQERRAIQLGLEGAALRKYVEEWTVSIEDISEFVRQQRRVLETKGLWSLQTPREEIYPVSDSKVAAKLGCGS